MFRLFEGASLQRTERRAIKKHVREVRQSGATEFDLSGYASWALRQLPRNFGDLQQVCTLSLRESDISSIAVLSKLSNLKSVDLNHCTDLVNVAPLAGLTSLTKLDLTGTAVSDFKPLKHLTGMKDLSLEHCNISDLSCLSSLTQLEQLNIGNTKITDISMLENLTDLKSLSLWNLSVTDFTPLAKLTKLETLDLWNTRISDLNPLAGMTSLTNLDLSHSDVEDLTSLKDLQNLTELALWNTRFQAEGQTRQQYVGRLFDENALFAAIGKGDLQEVKTRVARGARLSCSGWGSLLGAAIECDHLDICRFLVSLIPEDLNEWTNYNGQYPSETPLALAIRCNKPEIVDFLLDSGARVCAVEGTWDEPWFAGQHMAAAARANNVSMMKLLLGQGAEQFARDENGLTALHWAIAKDKGETACFLLNLWRADRGLDALDAADVTKSMLMDVLEQIGAPEGAFSDAFHQIPHS